MEKTLQANARIARRMAQNYLLIGLGWGTIGGIAGTLVMDLILMGALAVFGSPLLICFAIVGNTVERFFSMQNVEVARAIYLGIATHYVVGPVIGAIFGLAIMRVKALHVYTLKKSILLGILYVEIISQPLLATTPILLKMTGPATLQWYAGSFIMHLIAGAVLGIVVGRGLKLETQNRSISRSIPGEKH